jgi:hypothetical protein
MAYLVSEPQRSNTGMQRTALRTHKIGMILKVGFGSTPIPIYRCAAADAQAVGWRFINAHICWTHILDVDYERHTGGEQSNKHIGSAMGTFTQRVIAQLQQTEQAENLHEYIGQAADLLFKTINPNYISGRDDIDSEIVTPAEGEELKQAVAYVVRSHDDPAILTSAFFVLGKSYDRALKDLYIEHLQTSLSRLKQQNRLVFQLLIALDNIREDVFERDEQGRSSQGILDVDTNIRQAQNYLLQHDISVPW